MKFLENLAIAVVLIVGAVLVVRDALGLDDDAPPKPPHGGSWWTPDLDAPSSSVWTVSGGAPGLRQQHRSRFK